MRRAEFLRLTGLTVDNLKNFVRRDCIPFASGAQDEATSYDYRQAFATRLAIRLSDYLELRQAKLVVENYLDAFIAKFGDDIRDGKQIFFGYGHHFGPPADGKSHKPDVGLVAGPIGGLTESVIVDGTDGWFIRFNLVPLGSGKAALTGVAMIDAGAEMRDFLQFSGTHAAATQWIDQTKSAVEGL